MAGKSLLSRLGGKKGKYKFHETSEADKENHMDGKYRKTTTNSDTEPPPKRRKTEEDADWEDEEAGGGDEFWDDSMEFTQADLEDLELQASQAIQETKKQSHPAGASSTVPQPSTSSASVPGHMTTRELDTTGTFLKPALSRSSSSSTSSLNTAGRRSSSSHNSDHSGHTSHSSHSSYPSSLSYNSASSSSLKSGSSAEGGPSHRHGNSSLSHGVSSESLDMSGLLGRNVTVNQQHPDDVSRLKQESAVLKLQLEKMREEICVKDGENRLLRDNLKKRDDELSEIRVEKASQITQQARQQSDKEKQLQSELTKMQTQLQFKEQEEREMKTRCLDLEAQLKNLQTGTPSTSTQPMPQSPRASQKQLSPKPRRVPVEERSPKSRSSFPSKKTFLASEPSPKTPQSSEASTSQMVVTSSGSRPKLDERRTSLRLKTSRQTRVSGPQLVARLFDVGPTSTGQLEERGIVGLLNMPSTSPTLYNIQLGRDKNTSLLSPAKAGLAAFQTAAVQSQEDSRLISLVSTDHYRLAMRGLSNLLNIPAEDPFVQDGSHSMQAGSHQSGGTQLAWSGNQAGSLDTRVSQQDTDLLCSVTDPGSIGNSTSVRTLGQSVLDNAVLILPLINDYLQHYIELLDTALENSNSAVETSSSGSLDSSDPLSESLTGSLELLMKSTTNYANDLESLALAALQTLCTIVTCPGVREILLQDKEIEENISTASTETSSFELDMPNPAKPTRPSHIPVKPVVKLRLLRKVIRLCDPGSKDNLCNTRIILTCLRIMERLATHASAKQVDSMLSVLRDERLQHCIEKESQPRIILHALRVLRALATHRHVVTSMCTNATGCVLRCVYSLCTPESCLDGVQEPSRRQIQAQIVDCIVSIASNHKDGVMILLESDCQCSVEVVKSVVCLLHAVMLSYKTQANQNYSNNIENTGASVTMATPITEILHVIREGLLLLHIMSLNDPGFMNRHLPVQHQYVQLVCGLTRVFKHLPAETSETELMILQDLWDFDQEDSELSQDSDDTEEDPDTSTHSDIHMDVS